MLHTILIVGISVVALLIGVCAIAAAIGAGRAEVRLERRSLRPSQVIQARCHNSEENRPALRAPGGLVLPTSRVQGRVSPRGGTAPSRGGPGAGPTGCPKSGCVTEASLGRR